MVGVIENHLIFVAESSEAGRLGLIAGLVVPHVFNPKIQVLQEILWWVSEEYRGSRAGLLLLNEFVDWGKRNVDWIMFTLEKHSPVSDRPLIKRGFRSMETAYLLEVTR